MAKEVGEVHFLTSKQNKALTKVSVLDSNGKLVLASVGRRKWKVRAGLPYMLCQSPFHVGHRLKPVTDFGIQFSRGSYYLKTSCKDCMIIYGRMRRNGNSKGYVSLYQVRPYLVEIVEICGGAKSAAKEIGVTSTNIYRWLGNYSYERQKFIQSRSADRIITTLYNLKKKQ